MSKEKIESRRAFFKKAGKVLGATVAVPFLAVEVAEVKSEDNKKTVREGYNNDCMIMCRTCGGGCMDYCAISCKSTCMSACKGSSQ